MSEETDHGRDVELAKEDPEADEDEELTEEEKEARRRRAEEERKEDIEHGSTKRENEALEQENPDNHRDEPPHNS
ncbi:hypothetical protein ACFQMM_18485 [Saliphagus sp. GCM10025308]